MIRPRQVTTRVLAYVALISAAAPAFAALTGCAGISVPKDAPAWYKARAAAKAGRHTPPLAKALASEEKVPTRPEWQNFADDLSRKRAVIALRTSKASQMPDESLDAFRARVKASIAPGLVPVANDAPPIAGPRPVPDFTP